MKRKSLLEHFPSLVSIDPGEVRMEGIDVQVFAFRQFEECNLIYLGDILEFMLTVLIHPNGSNLHWDFFLCPTFIQQLTYFPI